MIRALLFILILCATSVRAEVFPALYDVTGVAVDDVLNIRAEPTGGAEKVGELLPTDKNVEVIALNEAGTWGQVNSAERSGWVSMKFLARRDGDDGAVLPLPLSCFATEPFWTLDLKADNEVHFDRFTDPVLALTLFQFGRSENRPDLYGFVAQGSVTLAGTIRRMSCNDGMSDREYGLDLQLMQLGSETRLWSGCCSLR